CREAWARPTSLPPGRAAPSVDPNRSAAADRDLAGLRLAGVDPHPHLEDAVAVGRGVVLLARTCGQRHRAHEGAVAELGPIPLLVLRPGLLAALRLDAQRAVGDRDLDVLVRIDPRHLGADDERVLFLELLD